MAACQLLPHQGGLAAGAPVDHRQRRCDAIQLMAPQQLPSLGGVVDDGVASLGEPPARRRRAVLPTSLIFRDAWLRVPRWRRWSASSGTPSPSISKACTRTACRLPIPRARSSTSSLPRSSMQSERGLSESRLTLPFTRAVQLAQISASSRRNPGSASPPFSASAGSIRRGSTGADASTPACQISAARCSGTSRQPSRAPLAM
jgi:hypothetical protein